MTPRKRGDFEGRNPSRNTKLQIAAKPSVLCCHLANTNEELGGRATAIPPFAKLLWSLLHFLHKSFVANLLYHNNQSKSCMQHWSLFLKSVRVDRLGDWPQHVQQIAMFGALSVKHENEFASC